MDANVMAPIFSQHLNQYIYEVWPARPELNNIKELIQVHGNDIVEATSINTDTQADGLISYADEVLCIRTADCLPVCFTSNEGHALIHAGWRGIAKEILLDDKLKQISPETIYIGPHIRALNYEVSAEFTKNFPKSNNFKEIEGRIFFDISQEAIDQLSKNYPQSEIIDCGIDTYSHTDFYSYRNGDIEKRNWNVLRKI
ncbi:hypothetical protein BIY24_13580 [Halobacteriovorax marinus]|nr:hypothetical protein BIY24_13580 [Halobacteriovorax marinus]